jgi:hypothetical protein
VSHNRISAVGPEGHRHLQVAARLAGWAVARDLRVDATRLTVAQADAIADAALAAGLDRLALWEAWGKDARRKRLAELRWWQGWDWGCWPWSRRVR